jgi:hypothetical protein
MVTWPDGSRRPTRLFAQGEQLMLQIEGSRRCG